MHMPLTAFLLAADIVPVAFYFVVIPLCVDLFASNVGTPFFHRCAIRYQTQLSGPVVNQGKTE
jgi:hypothetical protein